MKKRAGHQFHITLPHQLCALHPGEQLVCQGGWSFLHTSHGTLLGRQDTSDATSFSCHPCGHCKRRSPFPSFQEEGSDDAVVWAVLAGLALDHQRHCRATPQLTQGNHVYLASFGHYCWPCRSGRHSGGTYQSCSGTPSPNTCAWHAQQLRGRPSCHSRRHPPCTYCSGRPRQALWPSFPSSPWSRLQRGSELRGGLPASSVSASPGTPLPRFRPCVCRQSPPLWASLWSPLLAFPWSFVVQYLY